MRERILVLILGLVACNPPRPHAIEAAVSLKPCSAVDQCTEPGKECRAIDGVSLCVYTCPANGTSAGQACPPDQFAIHTDNPSACTCTARNPEGRSCSSLGTVDECGFARDESPTSTFVCSRIAEQPSACAAVGRGCRDQTDCAAGYLCSMSHACIPQSELQVWTLEPHGGPEIHYGYGALCPGLASQPTSRNTPRVTRSGVVRTLENAGILEWDLQAFPKDSTFELRFEGDRLVEYRVLQIPRNHTMFAAASGTMKVGASEYEVVLERTGMPPLSFVRNKQKENIWRRARTCGHFWVAGTIQPDGSMLVEDYREIDPPRERVP